MKLQGFDDFLENPLMFLYDITSGSIILRPFSSILKSFPGPFNDFLEFQGAEYLFWALKINQTFSKYSNRILCLN